MKFMATHAERPPPAGKIDNPNPLVLLVVVLVLLVLLLSSPHGKAGSAGNEHRRTPLQCVCAVSWFQV